MPYADSSCTARKSAICNQSSFCSQTFSNKKWCRCKHFSHSGTAFRSFIPDNYYITCFYFIIFQGYHCIFFRVKSFCTSFKFITTFINGRNLYYGTIGSNISSQNSKPRLCCKRLRIRMNYCRIRISILCNLTCLIKRNTA